MQHQFLLIEVREEFRHVVMEVEDSAAMGLYDTHRIAEKLMLSVLRIVLGWPDLRNLNSADKRDFPAIDLGSDAQRVGIQITATPELDKIKDSLTTFVKHGLDKSYDRVIFLILTKRQATYSQASIDKILDSKIRFDEKQDVIDYRHVLDKISQLTPMQITEIRDILRSYRLAQTQPVVPAWLMKAEPSLEAPLPFTSRWLLFSERRIPLIGRTRDMEALDAFMKGEPMFQWWAVCGPAGIGKTRLAHELTLRYQQEWLSGFRSGGCDVDFEAFSRPDRPTLVVIDYAARDIGAVRTLLLACRAGAARSKHKVRVLLLEREADKSTEWWRDLVEADDAIGAQIRNCRFRESLRLRSLTGDTVAVMKAWLEAGAPEMLEKLPASESVYWKQLKEVSEGRPLLIALAAAAFRGDPLNVRAPTQKVLLREFLTRELRQWRLRCSDVTLFDAAIRLIVVGTLVRGLPLPSRHHRILISFVQTPTAPSEAPAHKSTQLLTLNEISEDPVLSSQFARMFKQTTATLGEVVTTDQLPATFKQALELCPLGGSLQPDMIGEFFLDELWRPRLGFEEDATLVQIPEAMLGSIMQVSWRLNPLAFLATIEALKKTTTTPCGYLAFLAMATSAACDVKIADLAAEMFSRLLFNATVKIADIKTSSTQKMEIFGLLSMLKGAYTGNKGIAYRFWKVQYSCLREKTTDAEGLARLRAFINEAPALIEYMKTYTDDGFELSWAQMLVPLASFGIKSMNEELVVETLASAACLAKEFIPAGELKSILVDVLRSLAEFLAEVPGNHAQFSAAMRPIVERCLPLLMEQVTEISLNWMLDQKERRAINWSLINITFALAKLTRPTEILGLQSLITNSIAQLKDAPTKIDMRAKLLLNCQTAHLQDGNFVQAHKIQTEARAIFTVHYSTEGATAYLAMMGRMLRLVADQPDVFIEEFQELARFTSRLRDEPEIVTTCSQAFGESRYGLSSPAGRKAYVEVCRAHVFPVGQQNASCAAIYSANLLSASLVYDETELEHLDMLRQLLDLARRYPKIESVQDNLAGSLVWYWATSGKAKHLRLFEGCELSEQPGQKVLVTVWNIDRTILINHLVDFVQIEV